MRILISAIGAALLGASVLATSVFASTSMPANGTLAQTGPTASETRKGHQKLEDVLTGLVQKGVITQAQKEAILDAVKKAGGHGDRDLARQFVGDVVKGSSDYLAIPMDQLLKLLASGKSLGEIANATPGKSRDNLLDTLDRAADGRIKAAVDAGKLTNEQAEVLRPKVHEAITKIVDHHRRTPLVTTPATN